MREIIFSRWNSIHKKKGPIVSTCWYVKTVHSRQQKYDSKTYITYFHGSHVVKTKNNCWCFTRRKYFKKKNKKTLILKFILKQQNINSGATSYSVFKELQARPLENFWLPNRAIAIIWLTKSQLEWGVQLPCTKLFEH